MTTEDERSRKYNEAWAFIVERYPKEYPWWQMLSADIGWIPIIKDLVSKLDETWDGFLGKKGRDCWLLMQCKEKFGALRFYVRSTLSKEDEGKEGVGQRYQRQMEAISVAENKSMQVCEHCGKDAEPRSVNGWRGAVCQGCYDLWVKRAMTSMDKEEDVIDEIEKNRRKDSGKD